MRRSLLLATTAVALVVSIAACRGTSPETVPPAAGDDPRAFTGTVAEVMQAGGYTYARLQAPGRDDVWIAASEFPVANGQRLSVELEMAVTDFESKTLNRTFPLVYFVSSVDSADGLARGTATPGGGPALLRSRDPSAPPAAVDAIAPPAGGMAIADVWARREALAGKEVTVRGRVVKVNNQIMGRNWVHLQDGSGAEASGTHDLTVTTDARVTEGDTVTVTGVLALGKDFGAGYVYDVLLENGRVVR
jgi:hypothetical protein